MAVALAGPPGIAAPRPDRAAIADGRELARYSRPARVPADVLIEA